VTDVVQLASEHSALSFSISTRLLRDVFEIRWLNEAFGITTLHVPTTRRRPW
jgi:hypothetical protein